jgi:hemerythrin-like domain-containing protein
MCDYCGCRSMPVIADLSDDHERILVLADDIRRALAAGAIDAATTTLGHLRDVLAVHHAVEEASILPALAAEGLTEQTDSQASEHEASAMALAGLHDASDPSLPRLLDEIHDHIAREEYDLFPAALLAIGQGDWDRVERRAAEARTHGR